MTHETELAYLDTSALLKRYVPEANSETFDEYLAQRNPATISRLTLVELRSALARKRREGAISADREIAAMSESRMGFYGFILQLTSTLSTH